VSGDATGGWNVDRVPGHAVPGSRGPAKSSSANLRSAVISRLGWSVFAQSFWLATIGGSGDPSATRALPASGPKGGEPIVASRFGESGGGLRPERATNDRASVATPEGFVILRDLVVRADSESPLFPYSNRKYGSLPKAVCVSLKTSVSFTPHSPRAGLATVGVSGRSLHRDQSSKMEVWMSFLTYVDVVQSLTIDAEFNGKNLAPAAASASPITEPPLGHGWAAAGWRGRDRAGRQAGARRRTARGTAGRRSQRVG